MDRVRVKSAVPVSSDFADAVGTPVVINDATGDAYVLVGSTITKIAGATPPLHASTHASGGTDPVALAASQTTSGQFALARMPDMALTLQTQTTDFTITAGYGAYVPDTYEIAAAATVEIGSGATLEIG